VKNANGKVLVENDEVKKEWRKYIEKLLNLCTNPYKHTYCQCFCF